jgi:hypothetical protein
VPLDKLPKRNLIEDSTATSKVWSVDDEKAYMTSLEGVNSRRKPKFYASMNKYLPRDNKMYS